MSNAQLRTQLLLWRGACTPAGDVAGAPERRSAGMLDSFFSKRNIIGALVVSVLGNVWQHRQSNELISKQDKIISNLTLQHQQLNQHHNKTCTTLNKVQVERDALISRAQELEAEKRRLKQECDRNLTNATAQVTRCQTAAKNTEAALAQCKVDVGKAQQELRSNGIVFEERNWDWLNDCKGWLNDCKEQNKLLETNLTEVEKTLAKCKISLQSELDKRNQMYNINKDLRAHIKWLERTCATAKSFLFLHKIEKPDGAARHLSDTLTQCVYSEQELIKNVTTLTSTIKALKKNVSAYNSAKVKKQYVDYERQKETTSWHNPYFGSRKIQLLPVLKRACATRVRP